MGISRIQIYLFHRKTSPRFLYIGLVCVHISLFTLTTQQGQIGNPYISFIFNLSNTTSAIWHCDKIASQKLLGSSGILLLSFDALCYTQQEAFRRRLPYLTLDASYHPWYFSIRRVIACTKLGHKSDLNVAVQEGKGHRPPISSSTANS